MFSISRQKSYMRAKKKKKKRRRRSARTPMITQHSTTFGTTRTTTILPKQGMCGAEKRKQRSQDTNSRLKTNDSWYLTHWWPGERDIEELINVGVGTCCFPGSPKRSITRIDHHRLSSYGTDRGQHTHHRTHWPQRHGDTDGLPLTRQHADESSNCFVSAVLQKLGYTPLRIR